MLLFVYCESLPFGLLLDGLTMNRFGFLRLLLLLENFASEKFF